MTIEYTDVATARAAAGTRLVTSGLVPSPWSEAAKGLFVIGNLPVTIVAKTRENTEAVNAWTSIDNVPIVLHEAEPARTNWVAIVGLVARLAEPDVILPRDPRGRAATMGMLELVAGEQGLGWLARLAMIQASFETKGERGFPLAVAGYLAKRYGHAIETSSADLRAQVGERLDVLRAELGDRTYFGGERPSALDIYAATFLTPLSEIDETACAQLIPPLRRAFASAREALQDLVAPELWAHRTRMFERHLAWPMRLW
jgi:glutathione S-transferase